MKLGIREGGRRAVIMLVLAVVIYGLAGWLVLRAGATSWQIALMVVGYALLQFVIIVLAVPILIGEVLLLLSLLWPARARAASVSWIGR